MHKSALLATALTVLVLIVPIVVGFAQISVGVKKGDWIEYDVKVTGNPPEDHNTTWARMEVIEIEDSTVTLNIQNRFGNGTLFSEEITLDLALGILGDDFVIPKNLNIGDQFYDTHQGNITITNMEQRVIGGVERTVVSANTTYTSFFWDRETGIVVSATTNLPDYTMVTETIGTNLWQQPQNNSPEPAMLYTLAAAVIVTIAIIILILVRHRRKSK